MPWILTESSLGRLSYSLRRLALGARCGDDFELGFAVWTAGGGGCGGAVWVANDVNFAAFADDGKSFFMAHAFAVAGAFAETEVHGARVAVLLGLELGPLLSGQDAADTEEHFCVGLFEVGAGLGGVVDLGQDFVGVWRVGGEEGLHLDLLLFEVGVEVDELDAGLLEDVFHALLLVCGEAEPGGEGGVCPPLAAHAHVHEVRLVGDDVDLRRAGCARGARCARGGGGSGWDILRDGEGAGSESEGGEG